MPMDRARNGIRVLLGTILVTTAMLKFGSPDAGHFDTGWVIAVAVGELFLACLLACRTTWTVAMAGIVLISGGWLLSNAIFVPPGVRCGCFGVASGLEEWKGIIAASTGLIAVVGWRMHTGRCTTMRILREQAKEGPMSERAQGDERVR